MKYTSKMIYKKSTPGTHVYFGKDFPGLYIPKKCFQGEAAPEFLQITLESEGEAKAEINEVSNGREPKEL